MHKLLTFLIALAAIVLGVCSPASAQVGQIPIYITPPPSASYQGPGDVFSTGAFAFYSCARAYNAAYANGTNSLCDVVLTTGGAAACTIRVTTAGFADLVGTYCVGAVNLATACTAGCKVTKAYNQVSPGTNDAVNATLTTMPPLTLSSTPTGTLPAITCTGSSGGILLTGNVTINQPATLSGVYNRTSGTVESGYIGGTSGITLGAAAGANLAEINAGTSLSQAATDAAWHAVQGLANGNGTSSAINVDGSDSTGAANTASIPATALRVCRAGTTATVGLIAEVAVFSATSTSTNRNAISANQHSTNGYNF